MLWLMHFVLSILKFLDKSTYLIVFILIIKIFTKLNFLRLYVCVSSCNSFNDVILTV